MREIKFRGKRVDNGEWVYGDLFHTSDGVYIGYAEVQHRDIEDADIGVNEVVPKTVGQPTGLKDKNGKEIFEGDILKVNDAYQDYFIVEYSAPEFTLYDNKDGSLAINWEDWEKSAVVGNIYEDKHLLEGK